MRLQYVFLRLAISSTPFTTDIYRTLQIECDTGFRFDGTHCVAGSACKASLCTNAVPPHAHPICENSDCSFACNTGYYRNGDTCKQNKLTCTSSSQCHQPHPVHAHNQCLAGVCSWGSFLFHLCFFLYLLTGSYDTACSSGYQGEGGKCLPNPSSCGSKACAPISEGSVTCVAGECEYSSFFVFWTSVINSY